MNGNIGEWSEILATLRLIEKGVLTFNNISEKEGHTQTIVKLHKVVKPMQNHELVFEIAGDKIKIHKKYYLKDANNNFLRNDKEAKILNTDKVDECTILRKNFGLVANILQGHLMNKPKKRSFPCDLPVQLSVDKNPTVQEFIQSLGLNSISAAPQDKCDIELEYEDNGGNKRKRFSLKSRLGADPTLLNSSSHTLFSFQIEGEMTEAKMKAINGITGTTKILDRFETILKSSAKLKFVGVPSDQFESNLLDAGVDTPDIFASMLLTFYQRDKGEKGSSAMALLCEKLQSQIKGDTPKNINERQKIAIKIKKLLYNSSTYMRPGEYFSGHREDVDGGYMVMEKNAEIVAYTNDFYALAKYLLDNTKLETPSAKNGSREIEHVALNNSSATPQRSKVPFAHIYKTDNKYYIDLALQVRFSSPTKKEEREPLKKLKVTI